MLGPVFRAHAADLDKEVAVKVFRVDFTPEQAQKLAEALERACRRLPDHPNVVWCLGAGLDGSTAWLAQEYVAADALDARLRRRTAGGLQQALPILRQVADGIDAAAAAGVPHGSLHPRDILLLTTGDVHVTGFGVADAIVEAGGTAPIRRPYAAPERLAASREPATHAADVFALGAIAVEMLTGRRPMGTGATAVGFVSGVSEGIDPDRCRAALARALAESPDERFSTAAAFVDALGRAFDDDVEDAAEDRAAPGPAVADVEALSPARGSTPEIELRLEFESTEAGADSEPLPEAWADLDLEPAAAAPQPEAVPVVVDVTPEDWPAEGPDVPDEQPPAAAEFVQPETPLLPAPEPARHASVLGLAVPEVVPIDAAAPAAVPAVRADDSPELDSSEPEPAVPPGRGYFASSADESRAQAGPHDPVAAYAPTPMSRDLHSPEADHGPLAAATPVDRGGAWQDEGGQEREMFEQASDRDHAPPRRAAGSIAAALIVGLGLGFSGGYAVWGRKPADPVSVASSAPSPPAGSQRAYTDAPIPPPGDARPGPTGSSGTTDPNPGAATPPAVTSPPPSGRAALKPPARQAPRAQSRSAAAAPRQQPPARAERRATGPASIEVVSRPAGARVYIDGRLVGTTPLARASVQPGPRAVRLELEGYGPWVTTVEVEPGESRRLAASLELRSSR